MDEAELTRIFHKLASALACLLIPQANFLQSAVIMATPLLQKIPCKTTIRRDHHMKYPGYSGLQMGAVQINPPATRNYSFASYSMRLQTDIRIAESSLNHLIDIGSSIAGTTLPLNNTAK
jgi:hypothetical protein